MGDNEAAKPASKQRFTCTRREERADVQASKDAFLGVKS